MEYVHETSYTTTLYDNIHSTLYDDIHSTLYNNIHHILYNNIHCHMEYVRLTYTTLVIKLPEFAVVIVYVI